MQNGNDGTRATTSLLPSRSTAMSSCVPQSENQRRLSCQRGDSPNAMPVIRVCNSGTYLLQSLGTRVGLDSLSMDLPSVSPLLSWMIAYFSRPLALQTA